MMEHILEHFFMSLFNFFSVAIDNWTRFPLIEPQTDLECGRHIGVLPEVIVPGTSEMALFEKGVIVNIYLVRDIKPPNHEFCFSHFFLQIFLSLTRWKWKETFHWSKTNVRFISFGRVVKCWNWCQNLIVYLLFCFLPCQKKRTNHCGIFLLQSQNLFYILKVS